MSYRNQQALDYEPVTRRGGDSSRSAEEFPAPPPLEFPAPRFEVDEGAEPKSHKNSAQESSKTPALIVRAAKSAKDESWIVKRGHFITYLGIFSFTFVLYFRPYELFPALAGFSSMAMVLALLTLAIYVPSQFSLEGNLTARPREVNLLLLLTAMALISMLFATSLPDAWATFNDIFLKAVLMFIVMVNVVRTESRLKGLIWLSIGVSCLLSLNALDNYRAGLFTVEGYRVEGDLGGMFGNPNDMALHLVTVIPLAVALLLSARSIPIKLLYGAGAVLMVAGTVVTFSRGGFIGLAGSMVIMALKIGRRNRLLVILVSLVVVAVFLALAPGNYGIRILSLFDSNLDAVGSSTARQELLIRSLIVAARNPLVGVGMGNFPIYSIHDHVSHNAYTQVAAELGLAAAAFYTLFIVTPLKRLWQIEKETFEVRHSSRYYYLAVGMQASLIAYMLSSFFASVAYHWYVYYLVAYAIALRRIYELEQDTMREQEGDAGEGQLAGAAKKEEDRRAATLGGLGAKAEQAT